MPKTTIAAAVPSMPATETLHDSTSVPTHLELLSLHSSLWVGNVSNGLFRGFPVAPRPPPVERFSELHPRL